MEINNGTREDGRRGDHNEFVGDDEIVRSWPKIVRSSPKYLRELLRTSVRDMVRKHIAWGGIRMDESR